MIYLTEEKTNYSGILKELVAIGHKILYSLLNWQSF